MDRHFDPRPLGFELVLMSDLLPEPNDVIVLKAFEDVPRHLFEVHSIDDDHITGVALTGPLRGCYGEPDLELIEAILRF